jgi:hypothetical protein
VLSTEAVVEDEEFEYATPPGIFLSYQWGHQAEVKLLRQHLEMAGFSCWMDVGQMGGGDKLFEKIDTGIRGAKVIISCVSNKYAKSPNCNREVCMCSCSCVRVVTNFCFGFSLTVIVFFFPDKYSVSTELPDTRQRNYISS